MSSTSWLPTLAQIESQKKLAIVPFPEVEKEIIKRVTEETLKNQTNEKVLDEDTYTDTLTHIIKRDFYPTQTDELDTETQTSISTPKYVHYTFLYIFRHPKNLSQNFRPEN